MSAPYENDAPEYVPGCVMGEPYVPAGPPCVDCKGQCSVRGYRCERCSRHGCNNGIEPCADCSDDSDVLDGGDAVCFACAEKRGVCPMTARCLEGVPTCATCLGRPAQEMACVLQ